MNKKIKFIFFILYNMNKMDLKEEIENMTDKDKIIQVFDIIRNEITYTSTKNCVLFDLNLLSESAIGEINNIIE